MVVRIVKNKKKENVTVQNTNDTENTSILIYILYLLLVLLPQYFKGGYFEQSFLPFIVGISLMMIYFIIKDRKIKGSLLIGNETDFLLLLLTILYGITFFYAASKRGTIIEFIKYGSFLSLFLITTKVHKNKEYIKKTIDFIIFSGVILCIIGIGTMIGTWEYTASYVENRLSSTFQYPNTLAVYVSSMYFLAMGQALIENNPKKICLYGGALFIFFSSLIFTYSRGMWLIFPIIVLGFFIVLGVGKKVKLFFYTLGSLIVALPFSFLFLKLVAEESSNLWAIYIAGILLSSIVLFALGKMTKILDKISWKAVIAVVLVIGVAIVSFLLIAVNKTEMIHYENPTEVATLSRLDRNIKNVFPNTEYEIQIKGESRLNEEGHSAGRLVVYSIDEQSEYTHLGTFDILEDGRYELGFNVTTPEDTNSMIIYFENQNIHTSISYEEASIKDLETDKISTIPIKYKYIPETIVSRFTSISSSDNSIQARIIFSIDAFKLTLDSFLLGTGGQGWATTYRSIQSYPYWSNQVHNHYLQLFVETGILGIILFGGFLFVLLYRYVIYKKSEQDIDNKTLVDTLIVSASAILAHAAIDFDLSFVGLFIILWVLLGLIDAIVSYPKQELNILKLNVDKHKLKRLNIAVLVIAILSLGLSTIIYVGDVYADKAIEAQDLGDDHGLEKYLRKASSLDPYNTTYKADLINVYFYQYGEKNEEEYGQMIMDEIDQLSKLGKKDPNVYINLSQSYLKFGMLDEGLDAIKKSLELQPLMIESYLQNINAHFTVFDYYMDIGEPDLAKKTALEGHTYVKELLLKSNSRTIRPMSKDNDVFWGLNKLKYLGEQFDDYISDLSDAGRLKYFYDYTLDVDNDGYVELESSWNAENGKLQYEKEEGFIRFTNSGENYGVFDTLGLNLEPETNYLLRFDARGDMDSEKVNFYVMDTKVQEQNQSEPLFVEMDNEWHTYEVEFTTKEDVGEATARLRFIINGDNAGYMDIRDFKLFE